jgi:hypothetical protein
MNIELAPYKYWLIDTNFDTAKMHCFFLNIDNKLGWRLPTNQEACDLVNFVESLDTDFPKELQEFSEYWFDDESYGFWTFEDEDLHSNADLGELFTVIPVRDKDA